MSDIAERIEEALRHDTFWDTDAPPLLKDAVAEIKRLRLTDEECQLFVRLEECFESLAHFFDTPSGMNRKAKEAFDRDRRILKSLAERLA